MESLLLLPKEPLLPFLSQDAAFSTEACPKQSVTGKIPSDCSSAIGLRRRKDLPARKSRRRVRFLMRNDGSVLSSIQMLPVMEPETALWWNMQEVSQHHREAKLVASKYATRHDYQDAVISIMKSYRESASCTAEQMKIAAETEARGLEKRTVPVLNLYRKRAMKTVLDLQEQLRLLDSETKSQLIRQKSMQATRCSRHLALKLAQGDLMEAKKAYASTWKTDSRT